MTEWMLTSVMHFLAAILIQTAPVETWGDASWTWGDDNSRWITLSVAAPKPSELVWEFSLFNGEVRSKAGFALTARKTPAGGWAWVSWRETPDGRETRIATALPSPKELPRSLRMPPWVAGRESLARVHPPATETNGAIGTHGAAHAVYRGRELELDLTFDGARLTRLEARKPGTKATQLVIHLETPIPKPVQQP